MRPRRGSAPPVPLIRMSSTKSLTRVCGVPGSEYPFINHLYLPIDTPPAPLPRKKLTTAQYIYQALFKEEKSSDITVCARGKLWRLHKVYLCQSPYFASMFSGSWKETNKDLIDIDVVDPRITKECKRVTTSLMWTSIITNPLFPLQPSSPYLDPCTWMRSHWSPGT